ncbi:protein of unknown function [Methylotuvimicrobium alcaliphilum 20Z]|uniref:Uncharacterized protein n=1 Tax=Methylotuvimicrobium alcaliphilum (strain DSM 19304 / NCIMB 14124 / VKM B-2133 / 20Z) TaxID=1091494 RepID=G4SYI7_META2|nr:protein of unknown function [Methylotuvimicrobium alcaliphilum 20Z]
MGSSEAETHHGERQALGDAACTAPRLGMHTDLVSVAKVGIPTEDRAKYI